MQTILLHLFNNCASFIQFDFHYYLGEIQGIINCKGFSYEQQRIFFRIQNQKTQIQGLFEDLPGPISSKQFEILRIE